MNLEFAKTQPPKVEITAGGDVRLIFRNGDTKIVLTKSIARRLATIIQIEAADHDAAVYNAKQKARSTCAL